jgi:hypothetical protein
MNAKYATRNVYTSIYSDQHSDIYYDLSLHQIIQVVWDTTHLFHTKCVKIYTNGAWDALTVDAIDTKYEDSIDTIFQSLNETLSQQLKGKSEKAIINQTPNLH